MNELSAARDRLAELLVQAPAFIVFAESCTAGLCSATMGQVDGISDYLCGSAVTYRPATKSQWLGVDAELIRQHAAESRQVVEAMAIGVLQKTPEADWSAAVVGHLATEHDCEALVAIARRGEKHIAMVAFQRQPLSAPTRSRRQQQAAALVLQMLTSSLADR